jgi:hypothetical protein
MSKQFFSATIFFNHRPPAKYRTINNLKTFEIFARNQAGIYFNLYDKQTKVFLRQVRL